MAFWGVVGSCEQCGWVGQSTIREVTRSRGEAAHEGTGDFIPRLKCAQLCDLERQGRDSSILIMHYDNQMALCIEACREVVASSRRCARVMTGCSFLFARQVSTPNLSRVKRCGVKQHAVTRVPLSILGTLWQLHCVRRLQQALSTSPRGLVPAIRCTLYTAYCTV
ncbi:hypothetical protein T440DRAFT_171021 [Plenodomus tracheiphilus IPT5]|uniref:Uncharacterized protein n=1 Tax=Plenodomus tracheiphilus IPT5 TaxID=1408161 RepID=A0A6A7B205_9PLEO|nr:hypothetical protein T440DRAFT_171021 [Plenodomus tracheiphilus IPT5]